MPQLVLINIMNRNHATVLFGTVGIDHYFHRYQQNREYRQNQTACVLDQFAAARSR